MKQIAIADNGVLADASKNLLDAAQRHVLHVQHDLDAIAPTFGAVKRGMAMKVDISDNWDHWPWFERPLDEVREALGVQAA